MNERRKNRILLGQTNVSQIGQRVFTVGHFQYPPIFSFQWIPRVLIPGLMSDAAGGDLRKLIRNYCTF